jgi:hypothetical protein
MKNRKRKNCTSGSVRDEGGNILIYSAYTQVPVVAYNAPPPQRAAGLRGLLRLR